MKKVERATHVFVEANDIEVALQKRITWPESIKQRDWVMIRYNADNAIQGEIGYEKINLETGCVWVVIDTAPAIETLIRLIGGYHKAIIQTCGIEIKSKECGCKTLTILDHFEPEEATRQFGSLTGSCMFCSTGRVRIGDDRYVAQALCRTHGAAAETKWRLLSKAAHDWFNKKTKSTDRIKTIIRNQKLREITNIAKEWSKNRYAALSRAEEAIRALVNI